MKNYVQPGNTLTFTAAAAIASGEGLLMGTLFGVATASATTVVISTSSRSVNLNMAHLE